MKKTEYAAAEVLVEVLKELDPRRTRQKLPVAGPQPVVQMGLIWCLTSSQDWRRQRAFVVVSAGEGMLLKGSLSH